MRQMTNSSEYVPALADGITLLMWALTNDSASADFLQP